MSIAVMNWIWTSSPTSGNDRLVLLALADACSRDDGTGCWPSVATIARKANISARTVQRVLDRLERNGHLIVHRVQGGAHRSTNSYTVVIHNGCQPDARQTATGDTGDTPRVTQPRHPTGDTALSPNPPGNHQDPPPPAREPNDSAKGSRMGGGGEHDEFHTALGTAWPLSRGQRRRLAPRVTAALASGWTPTALATHVGANPEGVRSPYAVLANRLSDLPNPPTNGACAPKPTWCGHCDQTTRLLEHPTDDTVARCPQCHPAREADR